MAKQMYKGYQETTYRRDDNGNLISIDITHYAVPANGGRVLYYTFKNLNSIDKVVKAMNSFGPADPDDWGQCDRVGRTAEFIGIYEI